jgi:hypothetical protein
MPVHLAKTTRRGGIVTCAAATVELRVKFDVSVIRTVPPPGSFSGFCASILCVNSSLDFFTAGFFGSSSAMLAGNEPWKMYRSFAGMWFEDLRRKAEMLGEH